MKQNEHKWYQRMFENAEGKIILAQVPNVPLIGWIVFSILTQINILQEYSTGFSMLSRAFLFVWSYLELTEGVNSFRKILGLGVMCVLLVSFFV